MESTPRFWSLAPLRLGATGFSRRPPGPRLSVLIYHQVLPERDVMRPGATLIRDLEWQMELLAAHFRVLPLGDGVRRLTEGTLPPRAVCVTFDDGYSVQDVGVVALLRKLGIKATFFISSRFLDGTGMWNDSVVEAIRGFPERRLDLANRGLGAFELDSARARARAAQDIINSLKYRPFAEREEQARYIAELAGPRTGPPSMMMEDELLKLSRSGMEIGAHTKHHPILAELEDRHAREEIQKGRSELEAIVGKPVDLFAYPNGKPGIDFDERHVRMVEEAGFEAAFSTEPGVASPESDPFQIPRFTPWETMPGRFFYRLVRNYSIVPAGVPR